MRRCSLLLIVALSGLGCGSRAPAPAELAAPAEPVDAAAVLPTAPAEPQELVVAADSSAPVVAADSSAPVVAADSPAPVVPAEPVLRPSSRKGRAVPEVRLSPVTIGPKFSPELVTRVMMKHRSAFAACKVGSQATLRFTIGAGGKVSAAEALVDGSPTASPTYACVLDVVRGMRFPTNMVGLTITCPPRPWR